MLSLAEASTTRSGCVIPGRAVWNLRFAYDTTLIATSAAELQKQVEELQRHTVFRSG